MATAAQIQAGRKSDGKLAQTYRAKTGMMTFTYQAYNGPGGAMMSIGSENGDPLAQLKRTSIDKALQVLAAKGFGLPPITFLCSATEGVPCIACMGNLRGEAEYTIFMGPKTGQHNPQIQLNGIEGGLGKDPGRGVADQVYDGTQRWFGDPKMHGHAATVVIHEVGHILHEMNQPETFWTFKLGAQDPSITLKAANNGTAVSMYAMTNPLEFVAETFAANLSGKSFDTGVSNFYREIGGALPPSGSF